MSKRVLLIALLAVTVAAAASAQSVTTTEIRKGKVVSVYDNNVVVRMSDGVIRNFDVPDDFRFDLDGRKVGVRDLKPGMELTAAVRTTTKPVEVQTTEVRNGKVVNVVGNTVIVRTDEGVKRYNVPGDFMFNVQGKEIPAAQLRPGMALTATIVHTSETTMTEQEVAVMAKQAPRPPRPAPRPAPPAPAAAPAMLPSTASQLPLVALVGLALVSLGLGLTVLRRS